MAGTLKFTVEVASDQATNALKALTAASNQAGVAMKTSLASVGTAAQASTSGLEQLKTSVGRTRETMMFFTQSLGELGPSGRTAQIAVSGLAGAFLGGGGLVVALGLAQAAARIFTARQKEMAEQAAAARREVAELAAEAGRIGTGSDRSAQVAAQMIELRKQRRVLEQDLAAAQREDDEDAVKEIEASLKKLTNDEIQIRMRIAGLKAAEAAEAAAERKKESGSVQKKADDKAAKEREAAAKARADIRADEIRDAERFFAEDEARENRKIEMAVSAEQRRADEVKKIREKEQAWFDRKIAEADAKQKKQMQEQIALSQEWGATLGEMLGKVATGQMTLGDAVQSVGQKIISTVVQSAIAQITANASTAASGAAASQAGIPVVGPVLAISAMGAMMSAVLALLGNMPSARGGWWDTGNYSGLAMLHEREMVLPAREAEMVRRGAGGITVNVNAYDGRGFDRVLSNNSSSVARTLRQLDRRGGGR